MYHHFTKLPQGEITERITDPQQRLAFAWLHWRGLGSADPNASGPQKSLDFLCFFDLRSIFRFFDEDRDGFLSHEARLTFSNRHSKDGDLWVVDRDFPYRRSIAWKQELSELWSATKKEENGGDLTLALFQGACAQAIQGKPVFFFKCQHLHLKLKKYK